MERYESWIERANSSLELAKAKINPIIHYEDLCFQAQQSAEKALKGLLIFYNVEPEFTHNIEILINELENYIEVPVLVKASSRLTAYAVQTRYPGEYDELTKTDYEKAIKIASDCVKWVESQIKGSEEK